MIKNTETPACFILFFKNKYKTTAEINIKNRERKESCNSIDFLSAITASIKPGN